MQVNETGMCQPMCGNVSTHVVVFDSVIYISATAELNKGVTDEFILDI